MLIALTTLIALTQHYKFKAMVPLVAVLFIDVEWSIVQIRAIYQDLKDDYFDDRP